MRGIKRSQLVNMNQHYRRFSMDFFLDCQQRLGIGQIELWCGAAHFWLDHTGYDDVSALRAKLRAHGVRVVSVTAPSIAYQYQYAAQEPSCKSFFDSCICISSSWLINCSCSSKSL